MINPLGDSTNKKTYQKGESLVIDFGNEKQEKVSLQDNFKLFRKQRVMERQRDESLKKNLEGVKKDDPNRMQMLREKFIAGC